MTVAAYPHRLDRTIVIRARRQTVFSFFTNSTLWARWWGEGSSIDARAGGRVLIVHPGGVEASGEVREVRPPELVAFTYGYASGKPYPPGGSLVTIRLDAHPQGTLLRLTHEFADDTPHEEHMQGWRFQLSLFANVVANVSNAGAAETIDRWFEAWNESDTARLRERFAAVSAPDVEFRDRFSTLAGIDDLIAHVRAGRRFQPAMRIERRGDVRHCQWHVLADWVAIGADGQERGRGTNHFLLDDGGAIAGVTGFWGRP
jgi:uncharacterized protein YndB with AHSA1/START domain